MAVAGRARKKQQIEQDGGRRRVEDAAGEGAKPARVSWAVAAKIESIPSLARRQGGDAGTPQGRCGRAARRVAGGRRPSAPARCPAAIALGGPMAAPVPRLARVEASLVQRLGNREAPRAGLTDLAAGRRHAKPTGRGGAASGDALGDTVPSGEKRIVPVILSAASEGEIDQRGAPAEAEGDIAGGRALDEDPARREAVGVDIEDAAPVGTRIVLRRRMRLPIGHLFPGSVRRLCAKQISNKHKRTYPVKHGGDFRAGGLADAEKRGTAGGIRLRADRARSKAQP